MSDNLPPELVQQELDACFRIPTEVWTDVFKLLPRRILVQKIAPTCYRFKEISDKNVKNIHVITKADQFIAKLNEDDPEAITQLEDLAANKCQLAGQFRLSEMQIGEGKSQAVFHHCPDLFYGCQIVLRFKEENKSSTFILECLSQLEKAKPVMINCVIQRKDQVPDFWHNPTFQNCIRVDLMHFLWLNPSEATMTNIYDWLHLRPNGVDDASADQQVVRCMIVLLDDIDQIDWLLKRCSENIQQGRERVDRHPFVLDIDWMGSDLSAIDQFRRVRVQNHFTGEVLTLDHVMHEEAHLTTHRLRRCLAEEEANGPTFYAEIFERTNIGDEGYYSSMDVFKLGDKTPKVTIQ